MAPKVFRDKKKYAEMVEMLKKGIPYFQIGRHFDVDHSSIMYHAKKLNIVNGIVVGRPQLNKPPRVTKVDFPKNKADTPMEDFYENGEKINTGKNYADYRAIELKRNPPKTLEEMIEIKKARL